MKHPRWRRIDGFPAYEVSETGRVRRVGAGRRYLRQIRCGKSGLYLRVHLGRAGRNKAVHRLVCAAFHGPPPDPIYHADHIDGNPANNHASNLRWLPPRLNEARVIVRDGRMWRYAAEMFGEEPGPDDPEWIDEAELERRLQEAGW